MLQYVQKDSRWTHIDTEKGGNNRCLTLMRSMRELLPRIRAVSYTHLYVGGFRISCQYFNTEKDIDTMIEGMKDLIQEIGREPDYKK